jgi:hypothetical protein
MDPSIIAVVGTLGGAIVSFIGAYFIQKMVSERQRKWSLEDQDRNRQDELEIEQRRIKRELLSKRLEVVEETIKLRMTIIIRPAGEERGIPMYDDKDAQVAIGKRIQDISGEAWASIAATGSEDLKKCWVQIGQAYWTVMRNDHLEDKQWNQAQKAYVEMFKIMDEMKSKV